MTTNDGPGVPPERSPETTSVFRADFLSEAEPPAQDPAVSGVDALPEGAALLVVKRGPNAGSRFLLDRAVTSECSWMSSGQRDCRLSSDRIVLAYSPHGRKSLPNE